MSTKQWKTNLIADEKVDSIFEDFVLLMILQQNHFEQELYFYRRRLNRTEILHKKMVQMIPE